MKDIKDYLHLYINSEATYSRSFVDDPTAFTLPVRITPKRYFNMMEDFSVHTIKIFLRPLSSMTEDEKLELYGFGFTCNRKGLQIESVDKWSIFRPDQMQWLLSKGFDIFGLIESGLAI